jgi:hypothetical protein
MKVAIMGYGKQYDEYDLLGLGLTEGDKQKFRENNITPDMIQQLMRSFEAPELKLETLAKELEESSKLFYNQSNNHTNDKHKSWNKKKFYE